MTKKRTFLLVLLSLCLLALYSFPKRETKPFVTVKLQGGLGNKLFQVAAALSYAKTYNHFFVLPKESYRSKSLRKIMRKAVFSNEPLRIEAHYQEKDAYVFEPIDDLPNVELTGFFISEKYFKKDKALIQKTFAPSNRLKSYLQRKYFHLLSHPCCVGVHIRTYYPDYLSQGASIYEKYPPPDLEYLKKAVAYFPKQSIFVVVSDHIGWCKKHLKNIDRNFYFIEGERSYHDFYLLTLCKHVICSNSTFSWWAAYLNQNPNKTVICRTPWIKGFKYREDDVIPKEWIKIKQKTSPLPLFN